MEKNNFAVINDELLESVTGGEGFIMDGFEDLNEMIVVLDEFNKAGEEYKRQTGKEPMYDADAFIAWLKSNYPELAAKLGI